MKGFKGDIYTDELTLGLYATDASVYEIQPMAVVVPRDEADVLLAHRVAYERRIPILPRGAGTSLAGQTVGRALVIDFSRYMNQILEVDADRRIARVQPGVILDSLNRHVAPLGLLYGPDPATASRANLGGIIANNSSGSHSIVYGKAVDHIVSVKVALDDGTVLTFSEETLESVHSKSRLPSREGKIYQTLRDIIAHHGDAIRTRYPKVMRRVTGYNLDEFVDRDAWNLAKLICGSEGTLCTILEATVKLVPQPAHKAVCVVHFADRMEAIRAVPSILPFGPAAVELLDDTVVRLALSNPATRKLAGFIEGAPGGLLIVEFYGESPDELDEKHRVFVSFLREQGMGYAYPFFHHRPDDKRFDHIWAVRKLGLGLLLSVRERAKPQPFIEDACVPVDVLADYIEDVKRFCDGLDVNLILYAHASVGVLHVRPILDLRLASDIEKFEKISARVLQLVKHYKGAWSGEHGDGLVRSPRIPDFYGEEIYQCFVEIKRSFDPHGLMNPGKIVHAPPMTENLRYGVEYREQEVETVYHYRKELGFNSLVNMCNGIGVCQRIEGGAMCPSYKASRKEKDSTRARANALRLTLAGKMAGGDFTAAPLRKVLDLCISCKSCKTDCPSNVDVAKMKSEVLQMIHDKQGIGLREKLILRSDRMARRFAGAWAGLINWGQSLHLTRWVLSRLAGLDVRRRLPAYARQPLTKWFATRQAKAGSMDVVLFADTYITYHEPQIGRAVIQLLEHLDCTVHLVDTHGSKRPWISNGFLRKARQHGQYIVDTLRPYLEAGRPVIVVEPGSYSALKDDIPDLLPDVEDARLLADAVVSLERFTAERLQALGPAVRLRSGIQKHYLFAHCHQRALEGTQYLARVFDYVDGTYEIIDAGCCGMAGAFGYEREHYDFSKAIFESDLGPQLDKIPTNAPILATGFSCRHQIKDFDRHPARHWVEVLQWDS